MPESMRIQRPTDWREVGSLQKNGDRHEDDGERALPYVGQSAPLEPAPDQPGQDVHRACRDADGAHRS